MRCDLGFYWHRLHTHTLKLLNTQTPALTHIGLLGAHMFYVITHTHVPSPAE